MLGAVLTRSAAADRLQHAAAPGPQSVVAPAVERAGQARIPGQDPGQLSGIVGVGIQGQRSRSGDEAFKRNRTTHPCVQPLVVPLDVQPNVSPDSARARSARPFAVPVADGGCR